MKRGVASGGSKRGFAINLAATKLVDPDFNVRAEDVRGPRHMEQIFRDRRERTTVIAVHEERTIHHVHTVDEGSASGAQELRDLRQEMLQRDRDQRAELLGLAKETGYLRGRLDAGIGHGIRDCLRIKLVRKFNP